MKWRMTLAALSAVCLLASSWASTGCGGGGGGGGGPTNPPTIPPSGISFSPDASASANSISLSSGGGSGSLFILDVEVQGVTDVYGVSFLLTYPDSLLAFSRNSESAGTFLSANGEFEIDLQASERNAGEVTVGISRLGEVAGASGSGLLLSLEFTRRAAGTGRMEMTDHDALDSYGVVQGEVDWISGSITVR